MSPVRSKEHLVRMAIVHAAVSKLHAPYQWGADGPDLFDCSGFVLWCMKEAGILWDDTTAQVLKSLTETIDARGKLQPGDLAFYGREGRVSHVVMVLGPRGTWIIGANSGGRPGPGESKLEYIKRMTALDACVKIARDVQYRKDLVGFGALPWNESTMVT